MFFSPRDAGRWHPVERYYLRKKSTDCQISSSDLGFEIKFNSIRTTRQAVADRKAEYGHWSQVMRSLKKCLNLGTGSTWL